jgi:glyoxylase-like metal-dependent hydrolase (beta-lactamase superfamily II)
VQDTPNAESLAFYERAGMDPEELAHRKTERPFNFADCVAPLPLGYARLRNGGTVQMGGRTWDVRMGGGHAPEHATFWSRDDHLVIGGDQLLPSISPNLGVYPTEPDADPVTDWLDSCRKFQAFAKDDQLVLGGHKLPFTGLPLRLNQLISNHDGALKRLLAHLTEPRSAGECFVPLFKRTIGRGEYGLALVEALAHLNHLHQAGLVTRVLREDGAWGFQAA